LGWTKFGEVGIEREVLVRFFYCRSLINFVLPLTILPALIPPSSLLLALPYLPKYTQPTIRSRTLSSGLRVLHVPRFEHNVYAARVVSLITSLGPITTGEMAQQDGISIGLAKEMVESVEADGEIVRDQGGTSEEIKWFVNILKGYEWDGEADTGT
jgi:ESCRT-II complex subunit VPS36